MRLLFLISLITLCNLTFAQQDTFYRISSRGAGMAHSVATIADSYALFNNPAGIAELSSITANTSFEHRFGLTELSTISAGIVLPLQFGTGGLSFTRFGGEYFNVQRVGASYANRFGIASLGIRANYDQFNILNFGRRGLLSVDFGGIAELTPEVFFGAFARNISQASFQGFSEETLPTLLSAGLSYRPTTSIMANVEVEKDLNFPVNGKIGLEYLLREILFLRIGYQTEPSAPHFGLGFRRDIWQVDYAMQRHILLGYIHQFSFALKFQKDE
ncbi:hypothetical protein [Peijinzhouia sedimentorum]